MTAFSIAAFIEAAGDAAEGWDFEVHDELESTNLTALERARAGAVPGLVVIADAQRAGRGRHGRSWHSPPGENLYLSMYWEWSAMSDARLAVYAAGVAAARCCRLETGVTPLVKWPNDVHVSGRKLCGTLCESLTNGPNIGVVVGLGMNVNTPIEAFPLDLVAKATSLARIAGRSVSRERVAAVLVSEIRGAFGRLSRDPIGLLREWCDWAHVPGTVYRVRDDRGVESQGVAVGLGPDGALLLSAASGGVVPIYSADVMSYEVA